jgi:hypothetical protein
VTETAVSPEPAGAPRSMQSLQDFEPLLLAELIVLRAAASGGIAKVGYRRPRRPTPDVRLRAEFLTFLARGGGPGAPVVGRNLQIVGACIIGRIRLDHAEVPMSLWLYRCQLGASPRLDGAHIQGSLSFVDSSMPGLYAEGCRIDGDLSFASGSQVDGEVRLMAARIGGDLCASHARISGTLDDAGSRSVALNLDRMVLAGTARLDAGFAAAGQVRMQQARIEGDLDCSGATFDAIGDASWGENAAPLLLDRARIGGALVLRDLQGPLQGASLMQARASTLRDDAGTWGQHHLLDGFAYSSFGAEAPTDAPMRLDWLARQDVAHLGSDYRPDPWRRVIKALRRAGQDRSAREVAIGREQHLRQAGLIGRGAPSALRWAVRGAHDLFGMCAGYGHRPLRLLVGAAAVWLLCGMLFWAAAERGALAPSAQMLLADPRLASCRPDCAQLPATAPTFQPFVHSLDVLLPLVDLRQQRHWAPARDAMAIDVERWIGTPLVQLLTWFEGAFGWIAALTLLAAVTGLTDRDRRV